MFKNFSLLKKTIYKEKFPISLAVVQRPTAAVLLNYNTLNKLMLYWRQ
jgi:hypothetical protein